MYYVIQKVTPKTCCLYISNVRGKKSIKCPYATFCLGFQNEQNHFSNFELTVETLGKEYYLAEF